MSKTMRYSPDIRAAVFANSSEYCTSQADYLWNRSLYTATSTALHI